MPYLKLHASMRHSLCKGWTPKMFLLTNGEYFLKNLFCALCVFLQGFVINDTSDLAGRILKAPAQSRLFRSVSSCVYQCIRGWPSSLASCSIATKTPCSSKTYWHRLRVKSSVKLQTLLWIFNPRWRDFHVCKTPPVPRNVTFIFVILQHKVEPEGKTIICQSQRVWDGGKNGSRLSQAVFIRVSERHQVQILNRPRLCHCRSFLLWKHSREAALHCEM